MRFLLVFSRTAAVFTFVPIPGFRAGPDAARLLMSLTLAMVLTPLAPPLAVPTLGTLVWWVIQEFCLGLTVGVALSFVAEGTQTAAQMAGLQAGFSFASTIDPTTQADSSVLSVLTQLLSGVLFFSLGLHRQVIAIFVESLRTRPPGSYFLTPSAAAGIWRFGSAMFSMGVRLAMPVLALLLIIDVAFAVIGKFNAQLHLLSLAFPAKMLAGIATTAAALAAAPVLLNGFATQVMTSLAHLLTR